MHVLGCVISADGVALLKGVGIATMFLPRANRKTLQSDLFTQPVVVGQAWNRST